MYDYYLDPNACLYGLQSGSELVHVMYDPVNGTPLVVNNLFNGTMHGYIEVRPFGFPARNTLISVVGWNVPEQFIIIK